MEIQKIADQKLQSLANDPNNIVYKYEDGEVPENVMPLPDVKDNIMALWKRFKEVKAGKTLSYRQCRGIRRSLEDEGWASFSKTHPLIFDRVVDHRTGEPEIKALLYMIFLKSMHDKGDIENGQEQLQSYIFEKFAMSEEAYRAQGGDVQIIDPTNPPTK
jgi:hypothetical protein